MRHDDVINHFQRYHDGRLDRLSWSTVTRHLSGCAECAYYYRRMALLIDAAAVERLPQLQADPTLPVRIRTMRAHGSLRTHIAPGRWLRLSFAGAALALAVTVGVALGRLASPDVAYADELIIATDYYNAFSQVGFDDEWNDRLGNNEEL